MEFGQQFRDQLAALFAWRRDVRRFRPDPVAPDLIQRLLGSIDPHSAKGPDYTLRQVLGDFEREFSSSLSEQPEVEAAIRTTFGQAYLGLSEFQPALEQLQVAFALSEDALGADDPETLHTASLLAQALCERARLEEAEQLARATWKVQRRVLGPQHRQTLRTLYFIGW